jgi:hypothetical protein
MWLVPGYDCIRVQPCKFGSPTCKPGSGGSHGRHSAELWMAVTGHEAEVLFSVNTSWDLQQGIRSSLSIPEGIEVCWHTAWPQEGQTEEDRREPRGGDASCKDWKDCYQQSTGISYVKELTDLLVKEGSEAVFKWLENEYWKLVR